MNHTLAVILRFNADLDLQEHAEDFQVRGRVRRKLSGAKYPPPEPCQAAMPNGKRS